MDIRLLTSPDDLATYQPWVSSHPQGSLWQSLEWKTYQEALGRKTRIYAAFHGAQMEASALVIIDKTIGGFSTWDIPRGPLRAASCDSKATSDFMETMIRDAQKDRCLSMHLSPAELLEARSSKLEASIRHEQPEATRILDLKLDDEALLAQMHPKGRYNIKVAQKNGVTVKQSEDIDAYIALAQKTSKRDGFTVPSKHQLKTFLTKLPGSFLLFAYADETRNAEPINVQTPIAGLMGTIWQGTGYYYYGASDHTHRALMAPYLLQWEAIKLCKEHGCKHYDLLGIAPPGSGDDHHWSGISSFKEKFGGTVITYPSEQQIVLQPVMSSLLRLKRKLVG